MTKRTLKENWKYVTDQLRLALAEWLIWKAVDIAPEDHPDSQEIYEAARVVLNRGKSLSDEPS